MTKYLLMSIKPNFAAKIKSGEKTMELRRLLPKATQGDYLIFYESRPVCKITSYCQIEQIIKMTTDRLWAFAEERACVSKKTYDEYFNGKENAGGMLLKDVVQIRNAKRIDEVMKKPYVPQNFCYLTEEEFEVVKL